MVDVIRLLVSQGKSLAEVCEIVCDHCLAPDTSSGAGIGCDNMTILIVALLHGRTEEEWSAWITDRVKQKYGYPTPAELPQLYAINRLESFRKRLEPEDNRERDRSGRNGNSPSSSYNSRDMDMGPFAPFARVLGSAGGIAFYPRNQGLVFGNDGDNEGNDEVSDEEDDDDNNINSRTFGFTQSSDGDGDTHMLETDEDEDEQPPGAFKDAEHRQGEAPPPPKPSNGDAVPQQLKSEPQGDAPSDAVKAEGLLDASESPLKV